MTATVAKRDRALVVLLAVVAVLVAASLVVVFARGGPVPLDPGAPEGVVQRYVAAVVAGDEETAAETLSTEAMADCPVFARPWTENVRVTLVSTIVRATSADVRVSIITTYDGGLFGGSEYAESADFDMVKIDGEWRIDSTPWQLAICPE